MPDYAEVAGCSSFKNPSSPTYECYGAYATTTLVGRGFHNNFEHKNIYSAPNSVHYNNFLNNSNNSNNSNHQHINGGSTTALTNNQLKMNIIENKMDHMINNLNGNGSNSVPHTPMFGTIKRNRMNSSHISNSSNNSNSKLTSYSDKINFGENARAIEQPLFIKSKYDGTWKSIPSTTASNGSTNHLSSYHSNNSPHQSPHHALLQENNMKSNSQSYLTSFGKSDKV